MSTTSEIEIALDEITQTINQQRKLAAQAKAALAQAKAALAALPTKYSDAIDAINGYTPTGAVETLAKDKLAKLVAEYGLLNTDITAAETDLAQYDEF